MEKDSIIYKKYAIACWGLPLVLVAVFYTIDKAPHSVFKVGYGYPLCGWMQQSYVFLIPAAIALTVNVVCFLLTLISIERALRASQAALTRQQSGDRQRLIVYTKMVCVMGFTWAAGFLAAFTEEAALWWVYIVLNGLQGTFIAFSFVLNTRLLRFLKKRISERSNAGTEGRSRDWRSNATVGDTSTGRHGFVCKKHLVGAATSAVALKYVRRGNENKPGQGRRSCSNDDDDDGSGICSLCDAEADKPNPMPVGNGNGKVSVSITQASSQATVTTCVDM